jgi:hypothetical protein
MKRRAKATSIIEATRVPVVPRKARTSRPAWRCLAFRVQRQEHSNWCWTAVATSVALYYGPRSGWTQCAVADRDLRCTDCCRRARPNPCNVYGHLQKALHTVHHLDRLVYRRATLARAQAEIDAGRPLGARIAWAGGGAHSIAVVGYRREHGLLMIDDPTYGRSHLEYRTLCRNYLGLGGAWNRSYYTKP